MNVSVRKRYQQFGINDDSICRYIQRLERSARELADTHSHTLPITTTTYKWGLHQLGALLSGVQTALRYFATRLSH